MTGPTSELGHLVGLVVVGLAAARLWRLVARDTVADPFRVWLVDRFPRVFDWLDCPWCSGFWMTVAVWAVYIQNTVSEWVVVVFAAAQVSGMVSRMSDGDG